MTRALDLLVTEQWSPKQISGSLAPEGVPISHETIYKYIRKDRESGGERYKHCRHRLKHRKRAIAGKPIQIPNRTSIAERPMEADGKRFGDFEMDTIIGKGGHGAIVTIIERSTNMLFMRKLDKGKNAKALAKTVVRMLMPYKAYIRTITTDNGTEFACHEMISKALDTKVFFADLAFLVAKRSHRKREWTDTAIYTKIEFVRTIFTSKITKIMHKINMRPREKLNFTSPSQCFYEIIP